MQIRENNALFAKFFAKNDAFQKSVTKIGYMPERTKKM